MIPRALEIAHGEASARPGSSDDRLAVFSCGSAVAILVADGAGGTGGGGRAAETFIAFVRDALAIDPHRDPHALLLEADRAVFERSHGGETTAVVVVIRDDTIRGASVGDSEAWLVDGGTHVLTGRQQRKPLLGDLSSLDLSSYDLSSAGTKAGDGYWMMAGRRKSSTQ